MSKEIEFYVHTLTSLTLKPKLKSKYFFYWCQKVILYNYTYNFRAFLDRHTTCIYIFLNKTCRNKKKHANNKFIRKNDPSKGHKSFRTTERNTDVASLKSGQCFVHKPTFLHE